MNLHGSDILVVDDELWQCESFERFFLGMGATVRIAHTPEQALQSILHRVPSVIVLDVILEGNTAFTLLHELQSDTDLAKIPVVACTNLAENLDSKDLLVYGVRRVLDKATMHPQDVVAAVIGAVA